MSLYYRVIYFTIRINCSELSRFVLQYLQKFTIDTCLVRMPIQRPQYWWRLLQTFELNSFNIHIANTIGWNSHVYILGFPMLYSLRRWKKGMTFRQHFAQILLAGMVTCIFSGFPSCIHRRLFVTLWSLKLSLFVCHTMTAALI